MVNKDITQIPEGYYCHFPRDFNKICPYWSRDKIHAEKQENGYCAFIDKSDWERNEEEGPMEWQDRNGKYAYTTQPHEIGMSLLWDQCKDLECPKYP